MISTPTIKPSVTNFEKIFIIIWLSLIYSTIGTIVSFSFLFFYEFFRILFNSNSILSIIIASILITLIFTIFIFIPLILVFTIIVGTKHIIKNKLKIDINSLKTSIASSTKNKIIYYYILPALFFPTLAFSLFDLNIVYVIIITIVTILLRNLFDFVSDKIVGNKIKK